MVRGKLSVPITAFLGAACANCRQLWSSAHSFAISRCEKDVSSYFSSRIIRGAYPSQARRPAVQHRGGQGSQPRLRQVERDAASLLDFARGTFEQLYTLPAKLSRTDAVAEGVRGAPLARTLQSSIGRRWDSCQHSRLRPPPVTKPARSAPACPRRSACRFARQLKAALPCLARSSDRPAYPGPPRCALAGRASPPAVPRRCRP
jgi:hypothetical protein